MINLIKLEILSKNKDFDILFNNFRNRYFFHRESRIDDILGNKPTIKSKSNIMGCPYSEQVRHITHLKEVSHRIDFISKENGKYYGYVNMLNTPNGIIFTNMSIQMTTERYQIEDILRLYPVYRDYSDAEILTFDIGYEENQIIKKILNRK